MDLSKRLRKDFAAVPVSKEQVLRPLEVHPQAGLVASLPANVLDYWHRALIADDLGGLQATDVRIPLKNYARLAWPDFNLGFGTRPALALGILTERAAEARRKQQARRRLRRQRTTQRVSRRRTSRMTIRAFPWRWCFIKPLHQTMRSRSRGPTRIKSLRRAQKKTPQARPAEYRVLVSFRPGRQKPNMPATRPQRLPAACGPPMA
ncbi:hypothetical protein K2E96_19985 [Pseudomonas sp. ERGC3:05]|nr:hypothetical protein K2E96_19985 [Pseudomonas sp. ERGC3:05]